MKKIIAAMAVVPLIAACNGTGGGIEIGVSKKDNEWHVDVGVSSPYAKREFLLNSVIELARDSCTTAENEDKDVSLQSRPFLKLDLGDPAETIRRSLLTKARWSGPCSALPPPKSN